MVVHPLLSRSSPSLFFLATLVGVGCGDGGATSDGGVVDSPASDASNLDASADEGVDAAPDSGVCFSSGPYGTNIGDVAAPFTLPSSDGDYSFTDSWDCTQSVVVVGFSPGDAQSDQLFRSDIGNLVYPGTQPHAHYVFVAFHNASIVMPQLRTRAETALAALTPEDAADWRTHLHFIDMADGLATGTWVSGIFSALRVNAFAIDRFQRIRNVGSLSPFTGGAFTPDLGAVRFEPEHFDFEWAREQRLATEGATVVTGIGALTTHGERWPWSDPATTPTEPVFFDATFPSAATMATFDTLEIDLSMTCVGHDETRCNEWDRLLDLYLCPDGMGHGMCGMRDASNQVARWITSYHREGRWVTDITPMLARFLAGGAFHFYLNTPQVDNQMNPMILDLSFRLSNQHKPDKPFALQLFADGDYGFGPTYDVNYPDVTFTAPAGATRAEVSAVITGHGSDGNGCAEFCDHQHYFAINGAAPHIVEFPDPNTAALNGCSNLVSSGVLPNQYGTWNLGRGGWCPGFDVAPHVIDVTADTHLDGTSNTAHYEARYGGAPYAGASTGSGNLVVSSFLVFYR